jgi:chitinase
MPRSRLGGVLAAVALALLGSALPASAQSTSDDVAAARHSAPRTVGYFTQWGPGQLGYLVKNMETSGTAARLTHLNYAFGNVNADGRCFESTEAGQADANADYQRLYTAAESVDRVADQPGQRLAGSFNQLLKLKKKHPGLRTQISLGGWTWSKYFSDAALTDASRKAFVASCVDLYLKGDLPQLGGLPQGGRGAGKGVFDGIDIDWEWPVTPGNDGNVVRPEDKQNFTKLLAEFRRQLDVLGKQHNRHYSLTAFLAADPSQVEADYEVRDVFRLLDFGTVQGYDLHGAWESQANHQSAIYLPKGDTSAGAFSVDAAVRAYLDRGVPRNKVVVGVPFYSRGWTGVPNVNHGLFQTAADCAPSTQEECGFENYVKIKDLPGFTTYRDDKARFAWRFDGTTFWTFDDPTVLRQKARYITQECLGGAMIWSLDGDTANGELIKSLYSALR